MIFCLHLFRQWYAEQIQAARGRAKLIGRKLSAEQKATMASAAQAAEARLAATVSTEQGD